MWGDDPHDLCVVRQRRWPLAGRTFDVRRDFRRETCRIRRIPRSRDGSASERHSRSLPPAEDAGPPGRATRGLSSAEALCYISVSRSRAPGGV